MKEGRIAIERTMRGSVTLRKKVLMTLMTLAVVQGRQGSAPVTTDLRRPTYLKVSNESPINLVLVLLHAYQPHTSVSFTTKSSHGLFHTTNITIDMTNVQYLLTLVEDVENHCTHLELNQSTWSVPGTVESLLVTSDAPVTWVVCDGMHSCDFPLLATNTTTTTATITTPFILLVALTAVCGVFSLITVVLTAYICHTSLKLRAFQEQQNTALPNSIPPDHQDNLVYHYNVGRQNLQRGSRHESENCLYGVILH